MEYYQGTSAARKAIQQLTDTRCVTRLHLILNRYSDEKLSDYAYSGCSNEDDINEMPPWDDTKVERLNEMKDKLADARKKFKEKLKPQFSNELLENNWDMGKQGFKDIELQRKIERSTDGIQW